MGNGGGGYFCTKNEHNQFDITQIYHFFGGNVVEAIGQNNLQK